MAFRIISRAFKDGEMIPAHYSADGEDVSARGIKAQLQKLVEDEDQRHPLTDQAIVNILREGGVQIARRTVAKYRDQLGVLPARMRKRV